MLMLPLKRSLLGRACCRSRRRLFSSSSSASGKDGYQSIGSFHSENLADMLEASDADYVAPPLPFEGRNSGSNNESNNDAPRFVLDQSWTFLNHGAFGAALGQGLDRAAAWREHLERQPLRYHDRDLLPHLAHAVRRLAHFIDGSHNSNSSSTDEQRRRRRTSLALLPNVTSGLNAVLAGYARESQGRGQVILWDTSYGSVKRMAECYCPQGVQEIALLPRLHDLAADPVVVLQQVLDDFLTKFQANMQHTQYPPLLILDHTTSNTALTFPIETLARQAKARIPNMLVAVDGAHGLLAQDIDLSQWDDGTNSNDDNNNTAIDFYLSNGHKWLAAPRGVAFLYAANESHHNSILRQPAIVSHGVRAPDLLSRFVWDGCRDYAAALALPAVLDVWRDPATVRSQMKATLDSGIQCLAEAWYGPDYSDPVSWSGTVTLVDPTSGFLSPMALVKVPIKSSDSAVIMTSTDAKQLQDYLYHHKIEVPAKCVNGELYARVSSHVYNTKADFQRLAEQVLAYTRL